MSFNYKNPITPLSTLGNISVQRKNVFGTNFSILSTGGYMEVYNINELYYTIPSSTTGLIEYSGNTIPIQLNKGTGSPFSFDVLTLNSDNISSGRRRLGMLVYVIDEDQVYQYQIPNFISLWNSATGATGPGGNTVIFSDFGTTVKSNTPEGVAFISAWTSNIIEGVSGGTPINSTWKKLVTGGGGTFTGGTVTGSTIFTNGLTANTFSASTYLGLPGDIFITGGTFDNNTDTLTLDRSSGSSITITGFTDYFTTGATLIGDTIYFDRNDILSAYTVNLSAFTPVVDVFVTGGTYSAGTATFTNNTGGTFDVLGFYTGETDNNTYITGFTYSSNTFTISDNSGTTFNSTFNDVTGLTINGDLYITGNTNVDGLTANTISATTYQNLPIDPDTYVTGFTYSSNTLTIYDNSGNTFPVTINDFTGLTIDGVISATTISGDTYYGDGSNLTGVIFTGGTVSGDTVFLSGLTANTFSASTYLGLPIDVYVTGGTYSAGTSTFTNNTGGTFDVTGFYTGETDDNTYVTGFTYSANTFTISDNSGNTFDASFNEVTGLTVNGDLSVTGNTNVDGLLSATTISADTIGNVQYIDFDTTNTGTTASEGRLFWDVNNRTLSLGMIGGPIQQIGEEQYYLVENQTTGTLNDGTVVRAAGTSGASGKILVDYMISNATIPAFTTLGVLTQPLNSGDTGYVTSFGLVRGLDTTGSLYGETWFDGTILYVSSTNLGGFTSVKPITPNLDIIIAIVMKAGSGTTGSIFVRPDVYRPFKDPNRLIVAKQNGDFTSIKDALDTITTSSSSNRYVIDVGPGEFYEPTLDLTSKPYVSIVGSNIQTTLIIPTGSTQHIVNIGINNEISFLSFSGAGSGYAAIHCNNIGDFAQAHKCSFYDCDINIWVKSSTQDTKFYGEYLDFNGTYSYGTKVDANNGYVALANMENYFNFPTGSNITYCNWGSGSGATLNLFLSDNVSNGISGTTAFYIQDSAELNASTVTSDGCTYALRNPFIGQSCRFDVDGASFVNGEWDLYIENITTFGTFQGSSSHKKLYIQSPDIYWVILDIEDGELDITRKGSVTFQDGSHTDFTTLIFEGSTMGVMSGGTISLVSATTISTAAGYGYLETSADIGIIRRIDWNDSNISLSSNTENYIYINENGILSSSGSIPNTFFNILLGRVVTNSTTIEFIEQTPQNANHTSNRFSTFNRVALGPVYATGSIVTEGTIPFTLDVSAGVYFFSENEFTPSGGTPITFTQYYRDGVGGWITSATTGVTNSYYDGNGSLPTLTGYTKHTLYVVGDNSDEKYFLVLGQNQYSSLVQAEGALLPTPPTYFDDAVTQIANIYVQSGMTGITQIEDIRPVIGFKAGGVNASSLHANLLGLSSDDHLQYLLVNGGRAMSGNLDMGGNNIVSAGTINTVTIQSHATRHQFGGLDPVGSVTPGPNYIPYADVSGKLDSWITPITISGGTGILTGGTYPNFTLTNTLPDQTVTISGGTGILTGGTYPNFTLLNSAPDQTVTISGGTNISVTGTYPNFTVSQSGGGFTGGTVTGATNFTGGLTANTFSATTLSINGRLGVGPTPSYGNSGQILTSAGSSSSPTWSNPATTVNTSANYNIVMATSSNASLVTGTGNGGTAATLNPYTGQMSIAGLSVYGYGMTLQGPFGVGNNPGTINYGTSGQVLTSNGSSGNVGPSWVTPYIFTGGTVTGATNFTGGLTANTISATTYLNLPTDIRVTGATYSNNTFTYTNNTGGTFNVNFNTVTGLTVNGNLSVTGNTTLNAFSGTSGYISGSGQNILTIVGSGNSTTSPLFSVQGSNGELFSVTDSLTGSLFSVNDISGLPILEVFSDNTTLMGSYLSPSLNTTTKVSLTAGTNTIYSIPTSAYTGAFFDYTLISTGSTGARAGTIMSIWSGSTAQYTETSTNDIGTTTGVTFSVAVSGNNAVLSSSATTAGWTVKTIVRSI